jgi:hypothetical protein
VIAVPGREEDPTASPEHATPVPALPATVAAAHLAACAAELAAQPNGRPGVADLGELAAVVDRLIDGQQRIAVALAGLAAHLTDRHRAGALGLVGAEDLGALTEILGAAATASGHAADALAEGGPVLDIVLAAAGPDTRL